ncbi:MAG TPA: lipopolysaccharide heptosyltransferase I, partial [Candidatus Aminicenantes bacterium]|nr:lipopolysaccharide heptosyltransferase I [Candidatus Aminicenantes bacterium]
MQTIVVLRLSALGDILHTLPAFRLLRSSFPESRILWVAERRCLPLLEMVEGIDDLLPIDTRALRRGENLRENLRALRDLRRVRPDLSLDFQGTLKSAFTGLLLGSKERMGFAGENLREGAASPLYT